MLALSRSGRQQDALDAYEELRRSLDESFGLEPSPETRALQLMILNQDPAIAAPPATPRAEGAVRRPVALLVVELLLDDDLELEEAGAAFAHARRALDEVVARHGGSVAPESGLELLAGFGVEGAHEDDVLRASRAGVELREILRGSRRRSPLRRRHGTTARGGRPPGARRSRRRSDTRRVAGRGSGRDARHRRRRAARRRRARAGRRGPAARRPAGTPKPERGEAPFVGRVAELEALRVCFRPGCRDGPPAARGRRRRGRDRQDAPRLGRVRETCRPWCSRLRASRTARESHSCHCVSSPSVPPRSTQARPSSGS